MSTMRLYMLPLLIFAGHTVGADDLTPPVSQDDITNKSVVQNASNDTFTLKWTYLKDYFGVYTERETWSGPHQVSSGAAINANPAYYGFRLEIEKTNPQDGSKYWEFYDPKPGELQYYCNGTLSRVDCSLPKTEVRISKAQLPIPGASGDTAICLDLTQTGILADNGVARLEWQSDANLVLYLNDALNTPLWSSKTQNNANQLCFQDDGNLAIYQWNITNPRWMTNTVNGSNTTLILQHDCNLVLYQNGGSIWASNTNVCN